MTDYDYSAGQHTVTPREFVYNSRETGSGQPPFSPERLTFPGVVALGHLNAAQQRPGSFA